MPFHFPTTTPEHVLTAIEAIVSLSGQASISTCARFADITEPQAEAALTMAINLGLAKKNGTTFCDDNKLCQIISAANQRQKSHILRLFLETMPIFQKFRERLFATENAIAAAKQTREIFDIDLDRDSLKSVLISFGTYTHAILDNGGGSYKPAKPILENDLSILAETSNDLTSAENRIRRQIGERASGELSRDEIIMPLANALLKAAAKDGREAVVFAGNAFESFLVAEASAKGVNIAGATGINSKLEKFDAQSKLPKKLVQAAKYVGHIRNAADHGTDSEIGASWGIRDATGLEYVFVTCSFIAAIHGYLNGAAPEI